MEVLDNHHIDLIILDIMMPNMNGYEFKREIERIFKVARNMCPNVTDEMLYTNGAIHYMNGNDSTPFDWNCNNRLCEFFIFHKNEMGFIKAFVNSDNTIDMKQTMLCSRLINLQRKWKR